MGPFVSRLSDLMIDVDDTARTATMTRLLPLARHYQLTIYDALYLELAGRRSVPLATLDKKLAAAAQEAGVLLFEGAIE
ncbi:type II toxin-antitoxin system VapC family toxin [Blastomonas aquatica]|uniref:PIN domain-containing protein n=1 Tax=Blastomonas aquatica TaxID=1510276 RepID=A0ABQ1J279_9SPHN|nr:type II toxin-antitoxin system VapC family toxin [Blastomonas aquatica]GGB57053.1 hypothetical protein GCM10010833_09700 [Blastomonas aquatica]